MIEFSANPGEGFPIDYTTVDDSAGWTVTASIIPLNGGEELYPLTVEYIGDNTWRAHVTSDITEAMPGTRTTVRFVATDPAVPDEPDVELAVLRVSRIALTIPTPPVVP